MAINQCGSGSIARIVRSNADTNQWLTSWGGSSIVLPAQACDHDRENQEAKSLTNNTVAELLPVAPNGAHAIADSLRFEATCRMARTVLTFLMVVGVAGCTHTMQVRNLDAYRKTATSPHKLTIALEDRATTADGHQLFGFVREALGSNPAVEKVAVKEWDQAPEPGTQVLVKVTPQATYDGSGWNYLITFPGFVLFTHAWNGFVYSADVTTGLEVSRPGAPEGARSEIHTKYDLRHCDFARGAITSSGWYTPGWGCLNLIIGFFMVPYDQDATPDFLKEVRSNYGEFIAATVIEQATAPVGEPQVTTGGDQEGHRR